MTHTALQRSIHRRLGLFLVLACVAACRPEGGEPPRVLQEITLTDQEGRRLDLDTLGGQVVLLQFMFTHCPSVCPKMTKVLRRMHEELSENARRRVSILSVSVDPENDTPAALKRYAEKHQANVPGWRFVRTGDEDLNQLAQRLVVFAPDKPAAPANHSTTIYLFDRNGFPLQSYDGLTIDPSRLSREVLASTKLHPAPP